METIKQIHITDLPFKINKVGFHVNDILTTRLKEEKNILEFALAHWEYFETKEKAQDRIKELGNRILYLTKCKDSGIYNK